MFHLANLSNYVHLQYFIPVEVLTVCRPQCSLGVIPNEIGNLINLEEMALGLNNFGSTIPVSIFNMSALLLISLSGNQLVGNIPSDLGTGLPNLQVLHLFENNLSSASGELSFLTSLSMNCINLRDLEIGPNPLNGVLPPSIGNFSASLQILYLDNCSLSGSIPDEIGNLSSLVNLQLHRNNLTGKLPGTLANIQSLQGLFLFENRIRGTIPAYICKLESLSTVYLNGNGIDGPIPACIGNITTLRVLALSSNNLNSTIPLSLWNITDLLQLNLSSNCLTGLLPLEVGNLRSANLVDLSQNELSGTIPPSIGNLQDLETFSLADNRLQGSIPETVAEMVNLEFLDLSHNNLSGMIPPSMEKLVHLLYLNISFNGLSGSIPLGGPFENFTSSSFMFNKDLCGDPRYNVTPCQEKKATTSKTKWKLRVVYIVLGTSIFVIVIVLLAYRFVRAIMKHKAKNGLDVWPGPTRQRISYYELVEATDGYNERNLIGSGSFGSVYRGTLRNGKVVAVKVFHRLTEEEVDSFEVECNVLRGLRHRNLCKVIGSCSNKDFKALILDYMPRSLEKLLYSENCSLDLVQMISIMIDVAAALEYLHYGFSVPIVHCDLKPSNILLDEDMVGHVCDFGLTKLLGDGETTTQTITLATFGYMAPEYGTDGCVSVRCDVYSYGITLMEVLTGKKPTDEMFAENSSLSSWVRDSMTCSILDIINRNLVQENEACTILKVNCLHSVLKLALQCSSESPHDRISIKDANASLKKIRTQLLQGLRT